MTKTEQLAACFREGYRNDAQVEKAVRQIREGNDDAARARLDKQLAFDGALRRVMGDVRAPAAAAAAAEAGAALRRPGSLFQQLRQPPIAAAVLSTAVFIGLLIYILWDRSQDFAGRDIAGRMIDISDHMTGMEMEPVEVEAGLLGDWLLMKYNLEHYDAPPEFAGLKTALARSISLDEKRVAQIAFGDPASLLYIFRAADFDIPTGETRWRQFRHHEWSAAIRTEGELCYVIALQGPETSLAEFLNRHPKR
jgi:hypothetical protein